MISLTDFIEALPVGSVMVGITTVTGREAPDVDSQ
jgi:hypothetical protein